MEAVTLHENLAIIEVDDPLLLDDLYADEKSALLLLTRLSGKAAVVAPGQFDALLAACVSWGTCPKCSIEFLREQLRRPETLRRFDGYLHGINADKLKAMTRLWGFKGQMRKDECIQSILQALDDPQKVRAAIAGLEEYERTGLELIKLMGGEIEASAFAVGIYCSGARIPPRLYGGYRNGTGEIFDHFFRRGLIMSSYTYDSWLFFTNGTGPS